MVVRKNRRVSSELGVHVKTQIVPGGWGDLSLENTLFLLENIGQHFLKHFHGPFSALVRVDCDRDQPVARVWCAKGKSQNYYVTLSTHNHCVWAFQYAHELCHILSGFNKMRKRPNQWFQETLCDLASFFTIRQMAMTWSHVHPSNWASFSISIQQYAKQIVLSDNHKLPGDVNFREWFAKQEPSLRLDRYQRSKNATMALQLLPLVERDPANWNAIQYLPDSGWSFAVYLSKWKGKCPTSQQLFVAEIADLFGVKLA